VDQQLDVMSGEIELFGNEMHALVCTLHHHDHRMERPTLIAANQ
jgi:hypothetical protein